jgi:hypothetical protein
LSSLFEKWRAESESEKFPLRPLTLDWNKQGRRFQVYGKKRRRQPNLADTPTKLQLSKAQSSKDYWLKVSKQKKEERQGQKLPCLSEFPF